MNRREFLKRMGLGVGAIAVVPLASLADSQTLPPRDAPRVPAFQFRNNTDGGIYGATERVEISPHAYPIAIDIDPTLKRSLL